jgi:hypothetical protein
MSTDPETTRIVRSWLMADEHESATHVVEIALAEIDAIPQRRATRWPARRFSAMNNIVKFGLAAAAVLGLVFVGLNLIGGGGIGGPDPSNESPSPSLAASESPVAAVPSASPGGAFPVEAGMEPGTYLIAAPFPVDIELTLTEGWYPWTPGVGVDVAAMFQNSADPPSGRVIIFSIVDEVFADACDASAGFADPGPTVEDLAAALAGQPNTESTEPVEVAVSGYSGLYLDYTNTGECGTLMRWQSVFGTREALALERDQVWILDVDGVRLVIDAASFSETEEDDLAEMRTIIESLTIRP